MTPPSRVSQWSRAALARGHPMPITPGHPHFLERRVFKFRLR